MKATMKAHRGAFASVRSAVDARAWKLGDAGQAIGLFLLAADMATTAALAGDQLQPSDRRGLRRLWDDLRSQGE